MTLQLIKYLPNTRRFYTTSGTLKLRVFPGIVGPPGTHWYSGDFDPDTDIGRDGDFYLQLGAGVSGSVGTVWVKVDGTWGIQGELSIFRSEPKQIVASTYTVLDSDSVIAITRSAPSTTTLAFPSVLNRGGMPLTVFDWSTDVTDHSINITLPGETIMGEDSWSLVSNAGSLAGATFYPSTSLGGWYIAP